MVYGAHLQLLALRLGLTRTKSGGKALRTCGPPMYLKGAVEGFLRTRKLSATTLQNRIGLPLLLIVLSGVSLLLTATQIQETLVASLEDTRHLM